MRQFIILFLFIGFVTAADDALLETESGPKSSADLIKDASASDVPAIEKIPLGAAVGTTVIKDDAKADAVASDVAKAEAASKSSESKESKEEAEGAKVEAVPKETVAVAHKKPGEEAEVAAATEVELKPVESESRAKRDKEPESVLKEGEIIDVGAVGSKADVAASKAIADKSKSSESAESKEEVSSDAKKVNHEAVPEETIVVAHKKPGEEAEAATATKDDWPVFPHAAPEARVKREKEAESVLKEGEIIDVGAVGSKSDIAASKAIAEKSKSSESAESKEEESSDAKKVTHEAVPKESVAVAHKKPGEEAEVATATKVDIEPVVPEPASEARAKREKEPESVLKEGEIIDVGAVGSKADIAASKAIADKSKSSESAESKEEEQKEEPKEVETEAVKVSKVPTEEVAVAHKKAGEDEVEIATATKASIVAEKIEKSRARRFT